MDSSPPCQSLRRFLPLLAAALAVFTLACATLPTPTGQAPGLPAARVNGGAASTPGPAGQAARSFPPPPDRDLRQLATQLTLPPGSPEIPLVVYPQPVEHEPGRRDTFWLVDFHKMTTYQSEFELQLVTPRAYWYVEEGLRVDRADLEESAVEFEQNIYPRVARVFGREWSPGVDNDPHLNIVHARLTGALGYFSSSDEHSRLVYPFSNQREVIYINGEFARPGSASHSKVLAHELQHIIHWNGDPSEETWVNEGLAELAAMVGWAGSTIAGRAGGASEAGNSQGNIGQYLHSPTVSLIHWPLGLQDAGPNYGGASLFMHYLAEHYGPLEKLRHLVQEPADGIAGIDAYLEFAGHSATFQDVFRDWVVANLLDEAQGPYGYGRVGRKHNDGVGQQRNDGVGRERNESPTVRVRPMAEWAGSKMEDIHGFTEFRSAIPQYAPEYLDLTDLPGPARLRFQGQVENELLPLGETNSRCWWSNSGDSISSTLSRAVDLRGLTGATLAYQVWYDLEEDWDYGYVEVSLDQGQTWQILLTPAASRRNPIGNSFGPGYTGRSNGWLDQQVDLTPYAGNRALLRFHYVTDDAVSGAGLCLRRIRIVLPAHPIMPEAGLVDDDLGWQPDGFILTNNRVRQEYTVQVAQMGAENRVSLLPLNADNFGEMVVPDIQDPERLVLIIAASAPRTRQRASYTLTIEVVESLGTRRPDNTGPRSHLGTGQSRQSPSPRGMWDWPALAKEKL